MPGYPCCCGRVASKYCRTCEENRAPPYLKVVVGGMVNAACSDCAGYNGTYYLPFFLAEWFTSTNNRCVWRERYTPDPTGCGSVNWLDVVAVIRTLGAVTTLQVYFMSEPGSYLNLIAEESLAVLPDCDAWSGLGVNDSLTGDKFWCDDTSAVVTVTALESV